MKSQVRVNVFYDKPVHRPRARVCTQPALSRQLTTPTCSTLFLYLYHPLGPSPPPPPLNQMSNCTAGSS